MLTHARIWAAIDDLASQEGLSVSGLAKKAGLDATSFNKSKRFTREGRERWPSTESIAKVLSCTGMTVDGFMELLSDTPRAESTKNFSYREVERLHTVPLIGSAQAGVGGFFDDGGFPVGQGWDEIPNPTTLGENTYALKVTGDSMMPLYRNDDVLIVDPGSTIRKGDRVVAKSINGEVFAKILGNQNGDLIELISTNPDHEVLFFKPSEIEWIARIIWASQ